MSDDQPPPMARPRVAAGALFFDAHDRVLLVKPTYKDGWDIPGGYVEPGETPHAACYREVREELAIDPQIGRLLVVDWAPSEEEGDKVLFVFGGTTLPAEVVDNISLPEKELAAWEFHPPGALGNFLIARLARRVQVAVRAFERSEMIYAEHGEVVDSAPASF